MAEDLDEKYRVRLRKQVARMIQKETQKKYTSILREIDGWSIEHLLTFRHEMRRK